MRKPGRKPGSIDEYLEKVEPAQRTALQKLREQIRKVIPDAEEYVSYGVPSFRLQGRYLLSLGAAAKHCAFYPGAVVETHRDELKAFSTSKGTIRFQPDYPIPGALVRKLVRAQVERRVR